MNAKELKQRLTLQDIKLILKSLNAIIWDENDETLSMSTYLCHGGDSPNKLCYIKDGGYFYCQTHCHGEVDILKIVQNVKSLNLPESIAYIQTLLGLSDIMEGFNDERITVIDDWEFINNFDKQYTKLESSSHNNNQILHNELLNIFQPIYRDEWIKEGISKETMLKFKISYSTLRQSIIIPHFDINDNLIGIRQRNLLDFDVNNFGKYTPYSICGKMYSHKLNNNLYGININKNTIQRKKKVMIVESEKSCLQCADMFGINENFTLALCGCSKLSDYQINLLLSLEVNEVIIALDKQYREVNSEEYYEWLNHIRKNFINPLLAYFKINILWDTDNLLDYKDSPTDKGRDTLLQLMKNKIYIE